MKKSDFLYTEIPSWRIINTHTLVSSWQHVHFLQHSSNTNILLTDWRNRTSCCGFSFKSCRESGDGLMSLRPVAPRRNRIIRHRCFFRLALIAYTLNTVTSLTARASGAEQRQTRCGKGFCLGVELVCLISLHQSVFYLITVRLINFPGDNKWSMRDYYVTRSRLLGDKKDKKS